MVLMPVSYSRYTYTAVRRTGHCTLIHAFVPPGVREYLPGYRSMNYMYRMIIDLDLEAVYDWRFTTAATMVPHFNYVVARCVCNTGALTMGVHHLT